MKTMKSVCKLSRGSQYRLFLAVTILGLLEGLAMAGTGVMVRFQLGGRLKMHILNDPVSRLYTDFFSMDRAPSEAPLLLLSKNVGNTLLCLGIVVAVVSDLGLAGALYLRPLLVLFMLMMTMVIIIEAISSIFVLNSGSFISLAGKEAASMTLEDQALLSNQEKLDNPWMNGLHVLMVVLDCCGVEGPHDFVALYSGSFVPETCCRRDFVLAAVKRRFLQCGYTSISVPKAGDVNVIGDHGVTSCDNTTATKTDLTDCTMVKPHTTGYHKVQKTKGCYDAIFDLIESSLQWLVPTIVLVLLTQMGMVAGAMFVFNKRISWANCNEPPICQPV